VSLEIPSASKGDLTIFTLVTLFSKIKRVLPDVIGELFTDIVIKAVTAKLAFN
jgi:hypothetical protein